MLYLSTVDDGLLPATRQAIQGYADEAWSRHRSAAGLFCFEAGSSTTRLLEQAALVQIHACLAWESAKYDGLL